MVVADNERRIAKRYKLDWPVNFWHESTQRNYTGRSDNISVSGALIQLPLTVPIRLNEKIEIKFPTPENKDEPQYPNKVFSAKVVRVNRGQSILEGNQSVAVQFT
ncbi:MAG: PilZ domain-containing protein [Phycisphaerae bacterium]|jgi:c-di-GMP-binding flagellar brake protein YcgR|nr:PilZ domain-containing protein [Phycisphaerae bacterium]